MLAPTTSPRDLAKRYGVDVSKVLGWIHGGELRAINVAANKNGKPQFRIDEKEIEDFERRRAAIPDRKATPRRRRDPRLIALKQYVK